MKTFGINGNEANVPHRVGVGQYAYELLKQFSRIEAPEVRYQVYLESQPLEDMPKLPYKVFGPRRLWTLTGLQKEILLHQPSVLFTPTHYAPLALPMPSVVSIMDLAFERFPQYFKPRDLYQLRYWTWVSAGQASRILAISEFTKKEICHFYHLPPEKVVVTPLGYDRDRFSPQVKEKKAKIKATLKKYHIGDRGYLLFVGTLQPRKNLERLIEAYSRMGTQWQLIVVGMINEGRGGWMNQGIFDKVKSLGLESKVVFTGYVPDDDIPYLMAECIAYLLPSLYEGFGIPAVEAMATGTPVVVSRVSSLPDVCGEAAVYIEDPTSVESILQALRSVQKMKAGELVNRVDLGLEWVKRYNWEDTARRTLAVLEETARG